MIQPELKRGVFYLVLRERVKVRGLNKEFFLVSPHPSFSRIGREQNSLSAESFANQESLRDSGLFPRLFAFR
jgi:hypothetical protein